MSLYVTVSPATPTLLAACAVQQGMPAVPDSPPLSWLVTTVSRTGTGAVVSMPGGTARARCDTVVRGGAAAARAVGTGSATATRTYE
ncbi:hypothetical protein GCM10009647_053980 [Streptomyces sanglieri]